MPPKYKNRGLDEAYLKYRAIDNYEILKPTKTVSAKKLERVYMNNEWNLNDNFKDVQKQLSNLAAQNRDISWLNGIQYMDYKPKAKIDYTNGVSNFSLQALANGDYYKTFTQSKDRGNKVETEKASARHIEWFANNLPSFKKYENDDSCKWVVKDNVLLLAEILEYRNEKNQAVDTFSGDLKAIQRVIKLLLGEEAEMAKKISILQFDIKQLTNLREGTNKIITENEIRGFVPYENLLDVVDELEKRWTDAMDGYNQEDGSRHPANVFDAHLDLLTLALFVWDCPSRKEKFELQFEKKPQQWKPTEAGNYINVSNDTDRVIIHFNTEKKKHQPIHFELQFGSGKSVLDTYNNRLSDLLRRSYKLYKRKYVFIPKNTWGSNRNKEGNQYKPVASSTPSAWMRKFVSGRYININSLRSAFISYWWNKMNSNEKDILVVRMRTSKREAENNYRKDYNDTDTLAKVKLEPNNDLLVRANTGSGDRPIDVDNRAIPAIDLDRPIPAIPINRSSRTLLTERPRKVRKDARGQDAHERRYENWIRWYEKNGNKAKHNARASKRSTTTLAYAQRYARELNTGMMDIANVKDATVIKYGLEYDGNRWITTLTTEEMKCIDECKNGTDKEAECACDVSDTESVASLTEAEMDKLIRDASSKVLKATDKPTKTKKKVIEKVIENVVDTATNKRVRKPPQRYKAK
jgi:hypothetical protein